MCAPELARQSLLAYLPLADKVRGGGKSGLHRAECQVTPGGREPTESATESRPPKLKVHCKPEPVRVKGCGKSAPRSW